MSSRKLFNSLPAAHTARIGFRSKKALTEALQHGVFSSVFTTYDKEIESLVERMLTEVKNVYTSNIAIFPEPAKKKKEPTAKTKVVKGRKKPDPKAEVEDDGSELEEELEETALAAIQEDDEDDELDETDLKLIQEIAAAAKPKSKKKTEPADKSGKISNMGGNPSNNPIAVE